MDEGQVHSHLSECTHHRVESGPPGDPREAESQGRSLLVSGSWRHRPSLCPSPRPALPGLQRLSTAGQPAFPLLLAFLCPPPYSARASGAVVSQTPHV